MKEFNDRMALMYAKGVRYYEDEPVADATIDDLDMEFVRSYCKSIGYTKSPEEYIRENKKFVTVRGGRIRFLSQRSCCSERIRSCFSRVHLFALSVTMAQRQRSART